MKFAIIGAGVAGLAAARHCLEDGQECTVFEQTENLGGTWNYTENTDLDENGLPVHSSMYKGLRANFPKELMVFKDFPNTNEEQGYIYQGQILNYINGFAKHFNLEKHVKLLHYVVQVDPLPNQRWKVQVKDVKKNVVEDYTFDAVVVCNGHHSEYTLPEIKGLDNFKGTYIHSHVYRKNDAYKNRRVLIVGNGFSAQDITRLVSEVADKVFVTHRSTITNKYTPNIGLKPWMVKINPKSVEFEDGTSEEIDDIVFCTGYSYTFPFLTPKCGITVQKDKVVKPLYKQIVNIEHPTMAFLGLTYHNIPFVVIGLQMLFFLKLVKGGFKVTKKEMEEDLRKYTLRLKELGYPPLHDHKLGKHQGDYFEDLATTANMERLPPVFHKLYLRILENKDANDVFQIINEEEFIQVK